MITLVKLGGSLLTDKTQESTFRYDQANRIANEIALAKTENPDLKLIIGHGSGSFGHFAAKRHNTIHGVLTLDDWRGFAEVAYAAATLNALVLNVLHSAGLPILKIQPSASAVARNGLLTQMALYPLQTALNQDLIPLIYGDVSVDEVIGGTIISTEEIFTYIAKQIPVSRIILVGEVDGVYDNRGNTIDDITPHNFPQIESYLTGSRGTDVTGGMLTKVSDMLDLVKQIKGLSIHIIDGTKPEILRSTLNETNETGTKIHAGL